jgi:SPP1 gp7 family putative phage head morphogenesis protein
MFKFDDKFVKQLFRSIYTGRVTQRILPRTLYDAIANHLKDAIYDGYGTTWTKLNGKKMPGGFSTKDRALMEEIRTNIYLFSAAKTYQQVREMSSALMKNGTVVPFKQFREKAEQTYEMYNKVWLRTEYDTAIGQAQAARKWVEIENNADVLPLLEYSAVLDKRTSDICRPLDGIIAPVGDPIWQKIAPLNHFNCRCMLLPIAEGRKTPTAKKNAKVEETLKMMDPLFVNNPGQTGYVFTKEHPYFRVAAKDKSLAKTNFNLPIPKKDK